MSGQAGQKGFISVVILLLIALVALVLPVFLDMRHYASLNSKSTVEPADAVIVLTGGTNRVRIGAELLSNGMAEQMLLSGTHPHLTTASFHRDLDSVLTAQEIACCVALDAKAQNTRQNAIYSARWADDLGVKSVILVTSYYHIPRAKFEFSQHAPNLSVQYVAVQPESFKAQEINSWRIVITESIKLRLVQLEYFLSQWI